MPVLLISPNGVMTRKPTIADAVAAGDAADKVLLVTTDQTVSENVTIPATMELRFANNAVVTVDSSFTLTVSGEFQKPSYACFAGTGTVVIPTGGPGTTQNMSFGDVTGVDFTGTTFTGTLVELKGTDIVSADSIDLGASTGNYVKVTGTVGISSLGTATAGVRKIVEFTGILVLTYNATSLILPSSDNITTGAGDVATFVSLGSGNWKCVDYLRATGLSLVNYATDVSLQNGSLENITSNVPTAWTFKPYLNGSSAVDSSTAAHGSKAFSITSTSGANNGGGALISDYLLCSELTPLCVTFTHWASSGSAGMINQVRGRYFKATVPSAVTFQDSADTVTCASHGYDNGDQIQFSAIVSTTGVSINTPYYVINKTLNTFQLCLSQTGTSAVTLTTDGSGTISSAYRVKNSIAAAVTFTTSTNIVTLASHGFYNGAAIKFSSVATTTSITADTLYYVVNATTNTFQLASTIGGSALTINASGTGVIRDYDTPYSTSPLRSVTFQYAANTVTCAGHGYSEGDIVLFKTITTTTGISVDTNYYVKYIDTTTFQLALTYGGSAIDLLTGDGSGTVYSYNYSPYTPTVITAGFAPFAGAKFMKLDFIGGNTTSVAYGTAYWDCIDFDSASRTSNPVTVVSLSPASVTASGTSGGWTIDAKFVVGVRSFSAPVTIVVPANATTSLSEGVHNGAVMIRLADMTSTAVYGTPTALHTGDSGASYTNIPLTVTTIAPATGFLKLQLQWYGGTSSTMTTSKTATYHTVVTTAPNRVG